MDYGFILSIIVTFFGVTASLAYLVQAYRIWRRRSSEDISLFTFCYFLCAQLAYLFYGFHRNDLPVIATFTASLSGNLTVIVLALLYRRRQVPQAGGAPDAKNRLTQ